MTRAWPCLLIVLIPIVAGCTTPKMTESLSVGTTLHYEYLHNGSRLGWANWTLLGEFEALSGDGARVGAQAISLAVRYTDPAIPPQDATLLYDRASGRDVLVLNDCVLSDRGRACAT